MEAKKKAEELVAIFGKELAGKCVDEMVKELNFWYRGTHAESKSLKHWLEVKQEILNL